MNHSQRGKERFVVTHYWSDPRNKKGNDKIRIHCQKVTTNRIERVWRDLKRHIKCTREYYNIKGEFISRLDDYIYSFVYYYNRQKNLPYNRRFEKFLTDIRDLYTCHPMLCGRLIAIEKIQKELCQTRVLAPDAFKPIEDSDDNDSDEETVYNDQIDMGDGIVFDQSFDEELDKLESNIL